ncbi:hydantoinase B/oxoprolinase family protein [Candidatus Methylacidithermus pantelleriae]|uniref:Acetophenone carboxylase delta subunit n=1 Tax=Candidatus Methylacidithermus pantelleriae TaxID=2744239 RepID=A0A8J2BMC9_9BACT|nr:hydantoinase B/oxoprolinase family protein [Candidatus Methylacidithermus pantelleriae]CAF0705372.1 Acetophenone carboxylase delta subunit [Candidatus Methylacidithermus pantelleriae]
MDAVQLGIFRALLEAVPEEMGIVLRRTGFSPNIKERRDYSCAIFDRHARLVAQGDHMPVHLGSLPAAVSEIVRRMPILEPGDVAIANDPFAGGTHLPDLTMVSAVYAPDEDTPVFYVASRAHHSDVGGMTPGSMGLCREVFQEGLRIPPVLLWKKGVLQNDIWQLVLANVRTPWEREGDLLAQRAANEAGEGRLRVLMKRYGVSQLSEAMEALLDYSERFLRVELSRVPPGSYEAEDYLDDDGFSEAPVKIAVRMVFFGDRAEIDFSGSSPQCPSGVNATEAVTISCVFYVVRSLFTPDAPANSGLLRPLTLHIPQGTVVAATYPCAVGAGNVETSQRIVDTLLKALFKAVPDRVPAASQGTMNNFAFGGRDPRSGRLFAYYETIGGGMGGGPLGPGDSAVHTHMTNSLNTPVEAVEHEFPVRIRAYHVRKGSGGAGRFRGGDGIHREIEFLTHAWVSILSDRRRFAPYGLQGGEPASCGRNTLQTKDGQVQVLPGKISFEVGPHNRVSIETPGGGGWGLP